MHLKNIQHKIFTIRDQKVMFDFDLAEMYGVTFCFSKIFSVEHIVKNLKCSLSTKS